MKVHFISGLGADERVFQFLELPNIEPKYIKWNLPLEGEKINQYAQRLISQIDTTDEVVLVGMSFGGLIAQEIAKLIKCKMVILVSSVKTETEYDWKLKILKYSKLYKIIPPILIQKMALICGTYFFGIKIREEETLFTKIIIDTNLKFLGWAIDQIMNWKNENTGSDIFQIHGANDRIFPVYKLKDATVISDTGHFLVVNKSRELSNVLIGILENV